MHVATINNKNGKECRIDRIGQNNFSHPKQKAITMSSDIPLLEAMKFIGSKKELY